MKKRLLLALSFFCCSVTLWAQESIIAELDNQLLQKYIELARQHFPRKKTFDQKEIVAKSALNVAKVSVLDIFNGSYIYSPQTQTGTVGIIGTPTAGTNQLLTRGYLAGVTVNLGTFLSKPSIIKSAKANYEIAKLENLEYDAVLLNEVKSRYYAFLLAKKSLQLRSLASQNLKSIMGDVRIKYERAEIAIDAYTSARNDATEAEATALTAEVDFLKAKNALEEIIGVKLETVK